MCVWIYMCVQACPVSRQMAWDGGLTHTHTLVLSITWGQWNSTRYFGSLCRVKHTCLYMWRTERSAKTNKLTQNRKHGLHTLIQGDSEVTISWKKWKGNKRWDEKWKSDWFRRWGWVCVCVCVALSLTDAELASSDKNVCGSSFFDLVIHLLLQLTPLFSITFSPLLYHFFCVLRSLEHLNSWSEKTHKCAVHYILAVLLISIILLTLLTLAILLISNILLTLFCSLFLQTLSSKTRPNIC